MLLYLSSGGWVGVEPVAIALGEEVIASDATLEAADVGGPAAELTRGLLEGDVSGLAQRAQVVHGRDGLGMDEVLVDLAGDGSLEAAHDFRFGLAVGRAAGHVGAGTGVGRHTGERDWTVPGLVEGWGTFRGFPITGGTNDGIDT